MGGIISAILDVIIDVVNIILDIVITVINVIVDLVDSVIDALAGLLGFDDDIVVEQFQVLNQALFPDPDKNVLAEIIVNSIHNEEDMIGNILFSSVFQSGKKNVRQFTEIIENDEYFEDFPTVEANIITVDYDEVDSVLTTLNSTPVTIDTAKLGTLFVPFWIKYWLQVNKSYDHNASTFIHSSTTYTVNVSVSVYNSGTNDYTLRLGDPLADFAGFNIPTKPVGLHYVVTYHRDSAPSIPLLWTYKVGDGTYTDLDDPSEQFGAAGGTSLDILPAIPLRQNNTNFNATATTKSAQITKLVDKIGLDAGDLIDGVMEDVATSGISDYNNKVDHVFLNFGVRLWETSQIGLNYLFRFVSTLYPSQASTEGDYNAAPDEKSYNTLRVTGTDYKYAFTFAYIKFVHYTLAQVNADSNSTIFSVYYSDLTKFTSGQTGNSDLITNGTYYASSGYSTYSVGYLASTTANVNAFVAGTLAQESTYNAEAANWMQPTQRIAFTGALKNADGSTNSDGVVKPALLYERIASGSVTQITSSQVYYTINGTSPLKIEISGGGGAGGGAKAGSGSGTAGTSGGTTYAKVYNSSGTLLNTYSAGGGAGGSADNGGTSIGETGESFGGPGSNGVPSGAHSSFSGSGGAGGNDGGGSNASGYSAGGGGGGDNASFWDFDTDRYGRNGDRGAYYTVNHTIANYNDYVIVNIGGGGQGSGLNHGGDGSAGRCVLTPTTPVGALRLVNRASETTTASQEMIYYQIVANGLNAYTLKAPKCMLRVVDAQTGKFKMVAFNLAERTDLMVPMSYDMVKDLPNNHVTSLLLAAAHISLYVAHYEVIELPLWAKLLKIVQVVLFIMALFNPQLRGAEAIITFIIKQVLIHYAMKEIVKFALDKFSPEVAFLIIVATYAAFGKFKDLDLTVFLDLVNFLGDLTNVLGTVLEHYAYEELDDVNDEREQQELLQEKQMDALHEVQQACFADSNWNSLDYTRGSRRVMINPMSPSLYLANSCENYTLVGFGSYNYQAIYDNIYEQKILTT
jgi:hypothetical protein